MKPQLSNAPAGDERMLKITEWFLFILFISILIYQLFTFNEENTIFHEDEKHEEEFSPVKQVSHPRY